MNEVTRRDKGFLMVHASMLTTCCLLLIACSNIKSSCPKIGQELKDQKQPSTWFLQPPISCTSIHYPCNGRTRLSLTQLFGSTAPDRNSHHTSQTASTCCSEVIFATGYCCRACTLPCSLGVFTNSYFLHRRIHLLNC